MLENHITGCHGNYAFSHTSPNRFNLEEHFFTLRGSREQFGPHEKLSLVVQGRFN